VMLELKLIAILIAAVVLVLLWTELRRMHEEDEKAWEDWRRMHDNGEEE